MGEVKIQLDTQDPKSDKIFNVSNQLLAFYYSYNFRFFTHSIVFTIISVLDIVAKNDSTDKSEMHIISGVSLCLSLIEILFIFAFQIGLFTTLQKAFSDTVNSIIKCILCIGEVSLQIEFIMKQQLQLEIINNLFRIVLIIITFIQWEKATKFRYASITLAFIYIQLRCIPFSMDWISSRFIIVLIYITFLQSSNDIIVQVFTIESNNNIYNCQDQDLQLLKDKMTFSKQSNQFQNKQIKCQSFDGGVFSFLNKQKTLTNSSQAKENSLNQLGGQKIQSNQLIQLQQNKIDIIQKYQQKHQFQTNSDQFYICDTKNHEMCQHIIQNQQQFAKQAALDQNGIKQDFQKTQSANFGSPKLCPCQAQYNQTEFEEFMCSEEYNHDTNADFINNNNMFSRNQNTQESSARYLIENSPQNQNNIYKKSTFQNNYYQTNNEDYCYYPESVIRNNEQVDNLQITKKNETKDKQNSNPNSNQKIQQEGSSENLQLSELSPDFLMNRKKFKNQKQQEKEKAKAKVKNEKTFNEYSNNPKNKQNAVQLIKVQNVQSSDLDLTNQINGNIYSKINQNDYQQLDQINKQKQFLDVNPCLNTQNYNNFPSSSDHSQSPRYPQVSMPTSPQFYFMFFQILPEGILLLGQKQNKIHIQNRNFDRMMNYKGYMSVEKFLSLENTYSDLDKNNTQGNSDLMPQILNMKNIIKETLPQQKVNSFTQNQQAYNNSTQSSQQNNLLAQNYQQKYQISGEDKKFQNAQKSAFHLPSMPNISIISPESPNLTHTQQQEEFQMQQYLLQQNNQSTNISQNSQQQLIFQNLLNNQHIQNKQQYQQQQQQPLDESIIQKSTLRYTPSQPIQANTQYGVNKNSIQPKKDINQPGQQKESLAEDQILKQINNLRNQFISENQNKDHSYSLNGGNQQQSNQTFNNIEVTVSRQKTIGDLYKSLIMEIKQEIENNTSVTKYEAFESQVKMICSLPNIRKKNISNQNMKSQLYLSQLQCSQNQYSKCDASESVETTKKYYEVTCIPCVIEGSPSVLFVVRDITHFNQIKLLKHVNKNKSKMLSQVAHEFRTPLNCIISMMEIATITNPENFNKQQKFY